MADKINSRAFIKPYGDDFDQDAYIRKIKNILPSLDTSAPLVRSGKFIHDRFKDTISSYKVLATLKGEHGAPRIDALNIKAVPNLEIKASSERCEEFIETYLTANSADAVFAVFTPFTGDAFISYFYKSPRLTKLSLPEYITDYMAMRSLENYLAQVCLISTETLAAVFANTYSSHDDTSVGLNAKKIDAALRDIKFCDIACGSGDVIMGFIKNITLVREKLNIYLGRSEERTNTRFAIEFIEDSLYATDCDAGALLALQVELALKYPEANVSPAHFVWGSVLTEEIFGGSKFDIIATNPPHMRQELFSSIKPSLSAYASSSSASDLYCYYVERAFSMLKEHGWLSSVMSNRWMYSEYGSPLRNFLLSKRVLNIVDFGEERPLDGSSLPVSILIASEDAPSEEINVTTTDGTDFMDLTACYEDKSFNVLLSSLSSKPWSFDTGDISCLLSKLRNISIPLEKYLSRPSSRGILTGLNEAFVVYKETADVLVSASASSARLLRPFLSGRDVKRYSAPTVRKYLIFIPRGYTDKMRGETDPFEWLVTTYPAVAAYLAPFEGKASARRDKGDYWWELRSCKYYDDFDKPKIICPSIVRRLSAIIERDGIYSNDKTSIVSSDDMYLLGLLNSSLMDFYFRHSAKELLNEHYELTPSLLSSLPIHAVSPTNSHHIRYRDNIARLAAKLMEFHSIPTRERSEATGKGIIEAERELNRNVFQFYKLTPREISVINNN